MGTIFYRSSLAIYKSLKKEGDILNVNCDCLMVGFMYGCFFKNSFECFPGVYIVVTYLVISLS